MPYRKQEQELYYRLKICKNLRNNIIIKERTHRRSALCTDTESALTSSYSLLALSTTHASIFVKCGRRIVAAVVDLCTHHGASGQTRLELLHHSGQQFFWNG